MPTSKRRLLTNLSYEEFKNLVLATGAFEFEIISDYLLDMEEGKINGLVTGSIEAPNIDIILEQNGEMHYEMLRDYYLG